IMVDRLVTAYKNLDELNQDLEIRIESRTAALRLSNAQLKSELRERKQVERELSAERIRLMATLSRINEGVITTDEDNNVSVMNRVAAEITGWNEIDAIGKPIGDVFKLPVSADNGATGQDIQVFLKQHDDQENSSHITIVDTESREKELHINVIPIHTLYGEKTGTVFIFHLWINSSGGRDTNLKIFQA
ncbi:PAS domain-containing protein, partial [bacterium]|nr:PAS domain-containing protein [bacterium]